MTNAETKTQTRGHCQHCGREQAIVRGKMAHHGYTVECGYFRGPCSGHNFAPMQESREETDRVVAECRAAAGRNEAIATELEEGRMTPVRVRTGRRVRADDGSGRIVDETKPWADATEYERTRARAAAIHAERTNARAARDFAAQLEAIANSVHGQPLRIVPVEAGPAPIRVGERRVIRLAANVVGIVTRVERGRVYWRSTEGCKGWTGAAAWRKHPIAE